MEPIYRSFKLKNTSTGAVTAVLIGAMALAFAQSRQKDAVLTDATFKADEGLAEIDVTNVLPEGQSIRAMQEFVKSYGCKVSAIKVLSDSHIQATHRFTERKFMPSRPDEVNIIPAVVTLGEGFDTHKVIHTFTMPFYSSPNGSLCMTLEPNTEVQVEMLVYLSVDSL